MQFKELAGDIDLALPVPGVAAGTAIEWSLWAAPYDAVIQSVQWVPSAAVTHNATNYATLSLRNRTDDGSGSAVPASRAYSATDSTARVSEAMTLSGTAADLAVSEGDVLTLGVVHTGTGLLIPHGLVQVRIRIA